MNYVVSDVSNPDVGSFDLTRNASRYFGYGDEVTWNLLVDLESSIE